MSHITRIKTRIVDKELLLEALRDLGFSPEEGEFVIQGHASAQETVTIRVPVRLSHPIGLRWKDDAFEIIADWWGMHRLTQAEFSRSLMQRYAYLAARKKLEEQGATVEIK